MANDSLVPYGSNTPETREESLSRQFYQWEWRGRGWSVYDFPVELEPPFRPFFLIDVPNAPVIDDGRKPGFFENLKNELRGNSYANALHANKQLAEYESFLAETNEPDFCGYYNEEFTEHRLVLPQDLKITKPVAEQLLLSCSYALHPIAFEIIGNSEQIVVQFASSERDSFQVRQQIKSHLPFCTIIETSEFLTNNWLVGGDYGVIADFGLSEEFMLPLNTAGSFETDPLIAVTGALSNLQDEEVGVLQVLFQKAKFDWAEEIMDSVRYFDGTPFFVNAPEMIPLARQKISRPLFAAVIRVAAKSYNSERAWQIVRNLGAGFAPLSNPAGNELMPLSNDGYDDNYHEQGLLNRQSFRSGMILNSEELVSLVHPPSTNVQSEKLLRESEKTKPPPGISLGHQLILGENVHNNMSRKITLSQEQRTRHIHLIGSSGSGKSTLLLNLIKQDLESSQGFCVIDPHGDLINEVISIVPDYRINDVILFDPSDAEYPIGFNILQSNSEVEKNLLSSDLVATFRRMSTSWGDVMDSVLANAILAFVESSRGGTLFDLKRFLVEKDFRREFLETVEDDSVRYFWEQEFTHLSGKPQSSILIRLDGFLRQRLIRNIVCQKKSSLNFREIMDNRKVLLIKLSHGAIGEENSYLLGTFLVSKLYQTALSRQDSPERSFFSCYLDEFHHFITPSMESILSGVRKYNLGLVLAHQEFRQIISRSQEVAASILSNCYTRICFRLGDTDAERFAGGFSFFDANSLQNLSVGEAIGRIERSEFDFNLRTFPVSKVAKEVAEKRKAEIVRLSRQQYAVPRAEVEAGLKIPRVSEVIATTPGEPKSSPSETAPPYFSKSKEEVKTERTEIQKNPARKEEKEILAVSSAPLPPKEPISDSSTQSHRYLQSLIKRMAENKGFHATIEKEVFGGVGKIDVALESETCRIACEISVTNEPDYELKNIQKCLAAGYAPVVLISQDARHLQKIKHKVEEFLSSEEIKSIEFFTPEEFHIWLENLESKTAADEKRVKGFKVNVKLKSVDENDLSTRKKAISDVVLSGLKNLKNRLKGE